MTVAVIEVWDAARMVDRRFFVLYRSKFGVGGDGDRNSVVNMWWHIQTELSCSVQIAVGFGASAWRKGAKPS